MKTNAERQKDHRERRAARITRMRQSLTRIVERLDGNDKPLAAELRTIAEEGLA